MVKQPGMIDPKYWLLIANDRRPKLPITTDWISGEEAPVRVGWYERHFTDSMMAGGEKWSMQYWDGEYWRAKPECIPHWRQVGDYPCWRGLTAEQYAMQIVLAA